MTTRNDRRAGMTLIELLVVVAILGLLAVTVIPNLGNTTEARRAREAARSMTGFVTKAYARAIGRNEPAGFTLVPTASTSFAAIDAFLADTPAAYRGDTFDASATTSTGSTSRTLAFNGAFTAGVAASDIQNGDLIRFDGRLPYFELDVGAAAFRLRSAAIVDSLASQTQYNTAWPAPDPIRHTFEILRRPVRSGSPFSLADGRCIDLWWSGQGGRSTFRWFGITSGYSAGQSVTILFDASGAVRQIVAGTARLLPDGMVLLLVGRSDRSGQSYDAAASVSNDGAGANWQYRDSYWISIDPLTGAVRAAECNAAAADVVTSQQFIRSELPVGGR